MSHTQRHHILRNNGRTQHQNPMSLRTHHTCAVKCYRRVVESSCDLVDHELSQREVVVESAQYRRVHCSTMRATVNKACVDKWRNYLALHAVPLVRGETDFACKTKRPDGGACFAEVMACMQTQMSSSEQTFQRNPLPQIASSAWWLKAKRMSGRASSCPDLSRI